MEVTNLALGVLGAINPTISAIAALWTDAQNFGSDAERLRLRLSVQKTRLDSFERVLFEEDKFPLVKGRLFDQLPERVKEDFVELLRQLEELLLRYYAVRKRYVGEAGAGKEAEAEAVGGDERRVAILRTGDAKLSKGTSWAKVAWWVMRDKKSAEKLVTEFEAWTERVKSLLDLAWWPLPFFSTVSQMEKLEEDRDAGQIGMLDGIGMRKLLAPGSQISVETAKSLKISRLEFTETMKFQELEIGELAGKRRVIVEYKSYEQDRTGSINEIVSRRILQLVALLHEEKNDRFRVPRCINFFDDVPGKRIGFVFELPSGGANLVPQSLNAVLISKKLKPGLGTRMKLAHALAESLGHLHSVGWVHKSLRSENIFFLQGASTEPPSPDTGALEHPTIFGFEYSRLDSDFSSGRPDYDIKRNIYRHPQRWGQPSETFSKIHDVYGMSSSSSSSPHTNDFPALGVMLLEIGLWESLSHLDGGALLTPPTDTTISETATATRTRLLKHAKRRLAFYAGERYQGVVLTCLEGSFGVEVDDRLGSRLSGEFGRVVVDVLGELSGCL